MAGPIKMMETSSSSLGNYPRLSNQVKMQSEMRFSKNNEPRWPMNRWLLRLRSYLRFAAQISSMATTVSRRWFKGLARWTGPTWRSACTWAGQSKVQLDRTTRSMLAIYLHSSMSLQDSRNSLLRMKCKSFCLSLSTTSCPSRRAILLERLMSSCSTSMIIQAFSRRMYNQWVYTLLIWAGWIKRSSNFQKTTKSVDLSN